LPVEQLTQFTHRHWRIIQRCLFHSDFLHACGMTLLRACLQGVRQTPITMLIYPSTRQDISDAPQVATQAAYMTRENHTRNDTCHVRGVRRTRVQAFPYCAPKGMLGEI
jgi:hypothetical protein